MYTWSLIFVSLSLAFAGNYPVLPVSKGVTLLKYTVYWFLLWNTFVVTQGNSYRRKRIGFYLADFVLLVRIRFF